MDSFHGLFSWTLFFFTFFSFFFSSFSFLPLFFLFVLVHSGVVTIARFAELEDDDDRRRRQQGGRLMKRARGEDGAERQEPADVLVRAGCVQVLIGELEDCAENQSAADVAKEW